MDIPRSLYILLATGCCLLFLSLACLFAYEAVILLLGKPAWLLSNIVRTGVRNHPHLGMLLACICCILIGHFLWH